MSKLSRLSLSEQEREELLTLVDGISSAKDDVSGLYQNERVCCGIRAGPYNIVLTGVVLFLAFFAFNPIQAVQGHLQPANVGFTGLGILYAGLCLFNLLSSGITRMIGEKWAMLLGGISFILFLVAQCIMLQFTEQQLTYRMALYYSTCFLMGLGGALLYTAQGSLVTMCAPVGEVGKWSGIFFAIYMMNYICGGLIMQFVGSNTSTLILFITLTVVGAMSGVVLLLIHQPVRIIREARKGYTFSVLDTLRLFAQARGLLMAPLFLFSGVSATFYYGVFTNLPRTPPPEAQYLMGYCLVCFGAAEVIFSFLAGMASDHFGRFKVFVVGIIILYGGLVVSYFSSSDMYYLFFVAYFILGAGDGVINVVSYGVLATYFPRTLQAAFAFYRFIIAFGTAAGFLVSSFLLSQVAEVQAQQFIYLLCGVLGLGAICTSIVHFKIEALDGSSKVTEISDQETIQ